MSTTAMATATGKCLCGAVSFTADSVEHHVHSCHCTTCVKWSSGPMLAASATNVAFEGAENIIRYGSSAWAERGFCGKCGTNLFYQLKDADTYIMCTGTFDDQSVFELVGEIYIDEKPPGYEFAGDHPRQTGAEFMASMGAPES